MIDLKDVLADVNSLISLCRDEKTKPFLAEAIACYKAGAFRAAIVATWIAVVFDFIAKFRELDLTGDKSASAQLDQLEHMYLEKDSQQAIHLAQKWERTILDTAKNQFELLSSLQYKDLLRLHEDRHRCAHPSMHSLEEPYQPTEELVLYHLRNAVTCLLQHPPVQGKAAEKHIWEDIYSEYFPTTVQEASEHFAHSPLARAREPLLRRIIVGLTKNLLKTPRPPQERQRQYAALGAVLQLSYQKDDMMHQGNEILNAEFSSIVSSLSDKEWPFVITYLHHIPSAWQALSEPERKKTSRFIQHCLLGTAEQVITEALTIAVLREDACKRLPEFSIDALSRLLAQSQRPEYIEEAIGCWGNAESYEDAKIRTKKLIIPLIPVLQGPQIVQMVALFQNNNQLSDSFFTRDIILDLFRHSSQYAEDTKHAWVQLYEQFCEVRQGKLIQQKIPSLLSLIEDTYPNDIDPIRAQIREQYVQQRYEDGTQDEFFDTF